MVTSKISSEDLNTTIDDIVCVNSFFNYFWGTGEWDSGDAAKLLRESRLDRQVELSRTLAMWLEPSPEHDSEGRHIVAWVNLGTLVEGTMKWFLAHRGRCEPTALAAGPTQHTTTTVNRQRQPQAPPRQLPDRTATRLSPAIPEPSNSP